MLNLNLFIPCIISAHFQASHDSFGDVKINLPQDCWHLALAAVYHTPCTSNACMPTTLPPGPHCLVRYVMQDPSQCCTNLPLQPPVSYDYLAWFLDYAGPCTTVDTLCVDYIASALSSIALKYYTTPSISPALCLHQSKT